MKRFWTVLLVAGALPLTAPAGPQYSAEEIIEHFTRAPEAGDAGAGATQGVAKPAVRGVFIGAAGFGTEAGAAAASEGGPGAAAAAPGAAETPLAIPMTGANAGKGEPTAGGTVVAGAGQPSAPPATDPGTYDLLITFELDSARLTPQARENLDAFVAALRSRALQPYRFLVEGHTDATGPESYNQRLSERRAASVVDYLVANGIESSRVVSRGYGETRPRLADPEHPENRRVETRRFQ